MKRRLALLLLPVLGMLAWYNDRFILTTTEPASAVDVRPTTPALRAVDEGRPLDAGIAAPETSASGTVAASASGSPAGTPASSPSGTPASSASGSPAPSSSGTPAPSSSGTPAPSTSGTPAPSTSISPPPPSPPAAPAPPAPAPGAAVAPPRADDCASRLHLTGRVNATHSPHFLPDAASRCTLFPWSRADALRCLAGRTVWIIGNSVQRGLYYEALRMFNGSGLELTREDEKRLCGNGEEPRACAMSLGGVPFRFVWSQFFSEIRSHPHYAMDNCTQPRRTPDDIRACYVAHLQGSRPGDVLIHGPGMGYIRYRDELTRANPGLDMDDFIDVQLAGWARTVGEGWRGEPRHAFRMRLHHIYGERVGEAWWTDGAGRMNDRMDAAFRGTGWGLIDQEGINAAGPGFYTDHVHFPGVLSRATWAVVLSSLCGDPAAWGGGGGG